jgi:hypothetical protein
MGESVNDETKEQRRSPRIRSLHLTSYVPRKGSEQDYIVSIGRTLDVSRGGVKVEVHRELAKGTELDMDIAIEDRLITAKGVVVHVEPLPGGLYGTGIRFTAVSDDDLALLT